MYLIFYLIVKIEHIGTNIHLTKLNLIIKQQKQTNKL